MPKCAGTSFYKILSNKYKNSIYFSSGNKIFEKYPYDLDKFNLVAGHLQRSTVERKIGNTNDYRWLIILRNPVDRFFSSVAHARRPINANQGKRQKLMNSMELDNFLNNIVDDNA